MKRFTAILFLSVLLFNLFGYKLWIHCLQEQEEALLQNHINNNLQEEELVSIKVAITLPPYVVVSDDYEWTSGEVTVNGTIYKFVRKRLYNDAVEFLCLPDRMKSRLKALENDITKSNANGVPAHQKDSAGGAQSKPLFLEFFSILPLVSFAGAANERISYYSTTSLYISHYARSPIEQPPEANPV